MKFRFPFFRHAAIFSAVVLFCGGSVLAQRTVELGLGTDADDYDLSAPNDPTTFEVMDVSADLAGEISGAGGLIKSGAGVLTISGILNSYTGGTTIQTGMLAVADDESLGAVAGGVSILTGATLGFTDSVITGRTITLTGVATVDVDVNSSVELSGLVTGAGKLVLTGGTTVLSGTANDYAGGTLVSGGALLTVGSNASLGASGGAVEVQDSLFRTTANITTSRDFTVTKVIEESAGGYFDVATGTTLALTGGLDGDGAVVKFGAGVLDLTGAATTYEGSLNVFQGTVRIDADANLGGAGLGVAIVAGGLEITETMNSAREFALGGDAVIEVAADKVVTLSGAMGDLDPDVAGNLIKSGLGELVLDGASTRTGGTVVLGGVLEVSASESLGAEDAGLTLDGGMLRVTEGFTTQRAVELGENYGAIEYTDTTKELVLAGDITGDGGLAKAGDGAVRLEGDNDFGGDMQICGGTLILASGTGQALGGTLAIKMDPGVSLVIAEDNQINDEASLLMEGGTLVLEGVSEGSASATTATVGVGTLVLLDDAAIDMGAGPGSTIVFEGFSLNAHVLTVLNFTMGVDHLVFFGDPTAELDSFNFGSGAGEGVETRQLGTSGYYEVIPEPSTVALAMLGLGGFLLHAAMRRRGVLVER